MFFLLQKNGIRMSQYLRLIVSRGQVRSSVGRRRAVAANSGPVIFPRAVQGAIRTLALFRMRLYFPESLRATRETLALPIYPELSESQLQYVVDTIAGLFRK